MLDAWFTAAAAPRARVERDAERQRAVDAETAGMALYHYDSCMFCARVRAAIERLALRIALRDIMRDPAHRQALIAGGGRATVPCLRVDDPAGGPAIWMYESAAIVAYLDARFGAGPAAADPLSSA
jgi:glutathione S-transferase